MAGKLLATGLPSSDLELLQRAFDALHRTTGLKGRLVDIYVPEQHERRADALVEITAEGKRHTYVAVLKRVDRFATLGIIKHQFEQYDKPGLLVTSYVTPEVAERCRTLHIAFIDTAGNAYLQAPGLLVFVKGQRAHSADLPRRDTTRHVVPASVGYRVNAPMITTTPRAGMVTTLRVVFALLCRPELLNAPYRDIIRAAGVALGAVGGVFCDLHGRGYITHGRRKGGRRLLDPERLFEEWVTNYPMRLRPKLTPRRFRTMTPDWWQHADVTTYGAQWGSEVAVEKLTGYLKPETVTLYVRPEKDRANVARLVATHKLRADPQGEIEMLDTFWDWPADPAYPDIVPPILVYADLMATHDPRNLEAAQLLYDRKIRHALRSAHASS
jgi:hypothetical protein